MAWHHGPGLARARRNRGLAADRKGDGGPDSHSEVQDAEALIETEEEETPLDIPREEPLSDIPLTNGPRRPLLHATSARIIRGSLPEGDAVGPSVLLKLDRGRLPELRDALRIRPGNMLLRCECSNAYTIELRDAQGQSTWLSYHPHPHPRSSLGMRAWRGDGELLAGAALLYFGK